jgi:hypothetical protein
MRGECDQCNEIYVTDKVQVIYLSGPLINSLMIDGRSTHQTNLISETLFSIEPGTIIIWVLMHVQRRLSVLQNKNRHNASSSGANLNGKRA